MTSTTLKKRVASCSLALETKPQLFIIITFNITNKINHSPTLIQLTWSSRTVYTSKKQLLTTYIQIE